LSSVKCTRVIFPNRLVTYPCRASNYIRAWQ
jgi:hypothetical protein